MSNSAYMMGYNAAATFLHPDYKQGPFFVCLPDGRRRLCTNYMTALAWAKYLERRGLRMLALERAEPLPTHCP